MPDRPTLPQLLRLTCLSLALAGLSLCSPLAHAAKGDPALPGELLLQLRSASALPALQSTYHLSLLKQFGSRPIYRLKVTDGTPVKTLVKALKLETQVLFAEPNHRHQDPESRKNNPWAFGTEAEYIAQWFPAAMRLSEAQALSLGAGVRVAVLDTGVDLAHPALAGRLLPGFDFVDFDSDPSEAGSDANPSFGHGTHVAGLVALVAPGAKIMPLRVLDPDGMGNAWVLSEALLYAIDPDGNPATDDGAQVVNMSLGSLSPTDIFRSAAQLASCNIPPQAGPGVDFTDPGYDGDKQRCASSKGAVMAVAAGNDGSSKLREYPAAESAYGKLAVTSGTPDSRLADFSNTGSWIDLAAPGQQITSAFPGNRYATWSGTSMSAPLVAGTAALARSALPNLTAKDLARRIADTTSRLCGTRMRTVDAAAAITNKVPKDAACP